MQFSDSIDATAISLTPTWRASTARSSFAAAATVSHLAGAWSNSSRLDASWVSARGARLFWEAEGLAGGSAHSDGTRTGQLMAFGRGHFNAESRGAWLGLGLGAAWDVAWRDVRQLDAGAWLTRDATHFVTQLSPTAVDDTIRYMDVQLSAHHVVAAWELDASLGFRLGDPIQTLAADRKTWGSASAALWVTPRIAFVASTGTYPVDFTQGYPGGRYLALGVRFRSQDNPDLRTFAVASNGTESFTVDRIGLEHYRLQVHAPEATSVELAGDFTQWAPIALVRDPAGRWTTTVGIKEGTHEVAIRINGGVWRAPLGLTPITDEFGGQSGLLVLPKEEGGGKSKPLADPPPTSRLPPPSSDAAVGCCSPVR